MSLPSRERGLKFAEEDIDRHEAEVAPLAGAWIEIVPQNTVSEIVEKSLPSRERGLKLALQHSGTGSATSLPSRERGLKYRKRAASGKWSGSLPSRERGLKLKNDMSQAANLLQVAPLAGAWIEISQSGRDAIVTSVAPLAGAWIEIEHKKAYYDSLQSRSPRGSVD